MKRHAAGVAWCGAGALPLGARSARRDRVTNEAISSSRARSPRMRGAALVGPRHPECWKVELPSMSAAAHCTRMAAPMPLANRLR